MSFYEITRSFTRPFDAFTVQTPSRIPGATRLADVSDTHCWSLAILHPELATDRSRATAPSAAHTTRPNSARDTTVALAAITLALVGSALAALLAGGPPAPKNPAPITPEVARAIAERCASAPALCAPRGA